MSRRDIETLARWASQRAADPEVVDELERELWLVIADETRRYLLDGIVATDQDEPQVEVLFDTPRAAGDGA